MLAFLFVSEVLLAVSGAESSSDNILKSSSSMTSSRELVEPERRESEEIGEQIGIEGERTGIWGGGGLKGEMTGVGIDGGLELSGEQSTLEPDVERII